MLRLLHELAPFPDSVDATVFIELDVVPREELKEFRFESIILFDTSIDGLRFGKIQNSVQCWKLEKANGCEL